MRKFYVDTSIWLDLAFDRRNHVRPLGELAFQFFKKCAKEKWLVIYSEAVIEELEEHLTGREIEERCFAVLEGKNLIQKVGFGKSGVKEAEMISQKERVSFADALHAVIAKNNKAELISRDKHFERLSKVVNCLFPEEI